MEVNNKISNTLNINMTDTSNLDTKQNNNINREGINKKNKNILNDDKNINTKDILDKAIEEANNKFKLANKEFSYEIHEKTKRITVKIKDSDTGKVLKEIPSKESLDLSAKIMEMVGLLIDEKS